jgi:hypothetical protein
MPYRFRYLAAIASRNASAPYVTASYSIASRVISSYDRLGEFGRPPAAESGAPLGDLDRPNRRLDRHWKIPIFFATLVRISPARSSISRVCVAVTIVRMRAFPSGTVGKPIPVARSPFSNSASE